MLSTSAGRSSCRTMSTLRRTVPAIEAVTLLDEHDEVLEQAGHPLDVVVAVEGDLVAPGVDRHRREGGLDGAQHLVPLAEEEGHEVVAGDGDLDLGARHDGGKATGRPAPPRRRSPARPTLRAWTTARASAGTVPSRHPTGSWAAIGRRRLAARLEMWLADARIEGSADARARERWLHAGRRSRRDLRRRAARPGRAPRRRHRAAPARAAATTAAIEVIGADFAALRTRGRRRGAPRPRRDHVRAHRAARGAGRRASGW